MLCADAFIYDYVQCVRKRKNITENENYEIRKNNHNHFQNIS